MINGMINEIGSFQETLMVILTGTLMGSLILSGNLGEKIVRGLDNLTGCASLRGWII